MSQLWNLLHKLIAHKATMLRYKVAICATKEIVCDKATATAIHELFSETQKLFFVIKHLISAKKQLSQWNKATNFCDKLTIYKQVSKLIPVKRGKTIFSIIKGRRSTSDLSICFSPSTYPYIAATLNQTISSRSLFLI